MEFEQHGEDRAKYGDNLLNRLAERINKKGFGPRRLREFRQFYIIYPYLGAEVGRYLEKNSLSTLVFNNAPIWRSLTAKLQDAENHEKEIWRSLTAKWEDWRTPPGKLFNRLNYTCLFCLAGIDNPLKRAFYEQEAIRGCWTVKELERQVSSQYYERMGFSKDKDALQKLTMRNAQQMQPRDILHNPVTLEFLGMQSDDASDETKLETAILNRLQMFLLELGRGFCFEARQKRILIDQDYFKADLIFYHRILRCHVIIDLKIDRFRHEYASQLNLYMNYYKHEVMQEDDNPPIGLLLCTDYGETTVQYATEGLSQNLFVSKYRFQLPSEEEIRKYLLENISDEEFNKLKEEQ